MPESKKNLLLISVSKNINSKPVLINILNNIGTYQIIDITGWLGDTKLTDKEIDEKIASSIVKECCKIDEKLTQVLIIVDGRIKKEEVKIYNIIKKKILSEENITKYTSILRINFPDGEDCKKDIESLKNKDLGKNISKLANLLEEDKFIHIGQLPPPQKDRDEEEVSTYRDQEENLKKELIRRLNNYKNDINKPESLKLISKFLGNYVSNDKELVRIFSDEKAKLESGGKKNTWGIFGKNKAKRVPKEEKEVKESLLEASIEIREWCNKIM